MLVLTDVGKVYVSGEVQTVALRNINLTIEDGEFVVILGPSGSGKSTLLNVISGLDTASSGTIMFNDECLTDLTEDQMTEFRREHLGFCYLGSCYVAVLGSRHDQHGMDVRHDGLA